MSMSLSYGSPRLTSWEWRVPFYPVEKFLLLEIRLGTFYIIEYSEGDVLIPSFNEVVNEKVEG